MSDDSSGENGWDEFADGWDDDPAAIAYSGAAYRSLETALAEIQTLMGILPICSYCKKIRDEQGYWHQVESYVTKHSQAEFSHGLCQACADKYYPET